MVVGHLFMFLETSGPSLIARLNSVSSWVYSNEEFGYKLWDPATKKIIRSRDVVFFEDQTIEDLD